MKSKFFHNQVDDWASGDYHETVLEGEVEGSILTLKAE
jgi:penicillin amidase